MTSFEAEVSTDKFTSLPLLEIFPRRIFTGVFCSVEHDNIGVRTLVTQCVLCTQYSKNNILPEKCSTCNYEQFQTINTTEIKIVKCLHVDWITNIHADSFYTKMKCTNCKYIIHGFPKFCENCGISLLKI